MVSPRWIPHHPRLHGLLLELKRTVKHSVATGGTVIGTNTNGSMTPIVIRIPTQFMIQTSMPRIPDG